jgi:hypothetical protein
LEVTAMTAVPADASAVDGVVHVLTTLALIAGVGTLVLLATVGLTGWWVVRKIRRSRALRRGVLTVRSVAGDAQGRRIARQRLSVQRATEATDRALAAARAQGRPVGELPAVAARLAAAAVEIDDQLHLAEREPDVGLRRSLAAGLDGPVREHGRLSAELRACLLRSGAAVGGARLQRAGSSLALEVDALSAWGPSYDAPGRAA